MAGGGGGGGGGGRRGGDEVGSEGRCYWFVTGHRLGVIPPPPLTPGRPLMSLGVMPPARTLASVPLVVQEAGDGAASSTAQVPAAFTRGVTPYAAELDPINWSPVLPSSSVSGLSLSPATTPFPPKLVDRARSGQYVDMRDLLLDNVSLLQQLETFGSQYPMPSLPGVLRPRLREVTNLASWMYCFVAYVAMRANDQGVRDEHAGLCPPGHQGSSEALGFRLRSCLPATGSIGSIP